MAISAACDVVIGGCKTVTLRKLFGVIPWRYLNGASLEREIRRLSIEKTNLEERNTNLQQMLYVYEQKHRCEALFAGGLIIDAAQLFLKVMQTASDNANADNIIMNWLSEFQSKCIVTLENLGDDESKNCGPDEMLSACSAALSFGPSTPDAIFIKWAKTMMTHKSTDEVLRIAAKKFKLHKFTVYRVVCDVLQTDNPTEAVMYFQQMQHELELDASVDDEQMQWQLRFQQRCIERLLNLGDVAMRSGNFHEAVKHFSTVLSLRPVDRIDTLIKRCRARLMMDAWEDALDDADEVIRLNPSSYQGYEQRHVALHRARRHAEAVEAFDTMLSKLDEPADERIRQLRALYFDARPTIRRVIDATIRNMPRVLIDTASGELYEKAQQAEAFEAHPIFNELISSMTAEADHARIWKEVKMFYRYVMFSHKWEFGEPLLKKVKSTQVYKLKTSPANVKLQSFCSLVRSLGFRWAWSDTCCVDKVNNVVLQESLVAMFTWYRGSSLILVYLRGVSSQSKKPGGLKGSIWNTRAWTYQEYVAAETVQFYTEDWKPYLDLTMWNHKESPMVRSEMEQVSRVSTDQLAVLRPGLDRVREKLYLASTRETTLVEDMAYSLLGIFNVAIPVIYGEGNRAVGRFLEHILSGSGDVTILAWTGIASYYNSCLPTDLTVYKQLVPPHIPSFMEKDEVDRTVVKLQSSLADPSLAMKLYSRLHELPSPFLVASRLRLPGIVCRVTDLVHIPGGGPELNLHVYQATSAVFGDVEIKTADDLAAMNDLYLVHPWIRPLLDQEYARAEGGMDKTVHALRMVARLRQPFGALLFESLSRVEHKRVAANSLIMAQIRGEVSLDMLLDSIRTIEVQ